MTHDKALQAIQASSPDKFLARTDNFGYVCPACGDGGNGKGDGLNLNPADNTYLCHKCGLTGGILDLVGVKFNLTDADEQLSKAAEIYGIALDDGSQDKTPKAANPNPCEAVDKVIGSCCGGTLGAYLSRCHKDVGCTEYLHQRGISDSTISRFCIGFDAEFDGGGTLIYPTAAVVFPLSGDSYEARCTSDAADNRFRYHKHGQAKLFNEATLLAPSDAPVFVTNGIIDALSIIEAGGDAVALGGAGNYRLLSDWFNRERTLRRPLILLISNDGANYADKLAKELTTAKVGFANAPEIIGTTYKDVNDRLVHDAAGLKAAVAGVTQKYSQHEDKSSSSYAEWESLHKVYETGDTHNAFLRLLQHYKDNASKPMLSTGLNVIDSALNGGLRTGLYTIGAISSLGKTTLALQIADNLAKNGHDVMFFALEQGQFDLMTKSLSRESRIYCLNHKIDPDRYTLSYQYLADGRWDSSDPVEMEVINGACKVYMAYNKHVRIYSSVDMASASVGYIRRLIREHVMATGNHPVVFIDYMQLLKADGDNSWRMSDKQIVDDNVVALKRISNEYDIPIVVVSSLNRQSYDREVSMDAFKESGAIEYGSDVLAGLQLTDAINGDGISVNAAKAANPRRIGLKVLKNRNGAMVEEDLQLLYYTVGNCFEDTDQPVPAAKTANRPATKAASRRTTKAAGRRTATKAAAQADNAPSS